MKVLYFGCWDNNTGHCLFQSKYNKPSMASIPWKNIDGGLCPGSRKEGIAKIHHCEGWTALAFWDYSIDQRAGSNSVFLAEGTHNFDKMINLTKERFPNIIERFHFKITLENSNETGPSNKSL